VPESAPAPDLLSVLSLREIRGFLRRSHAIPLAVFLGVAYALGSMLEGGMLILEPLRGGTTIEILLASGTGSGWWNYPGLLVVAPWGILALPFFATIAMVGVSIGVGLGMAVAVGLVLRLLRPSPQEVARSKAVGVATGLTPAMIGLVTLGSCCTTTAAATGGIGLIAQASGTSTANLLVNSWYLGVAQLAIVGVGLFAQELLLAVYGGLLGIGPRRGAVEVPPLDRRWAVGAVFRGALAIGGILWSLSMLAEWTTRPPVGAGAGWWFQWVAQHQLLGALAVAAAFCPSGAYRFASWARRGPGRWVGGIVAVVALSLLVWLPPVLTGAGLDSLTDQVLGAVGAPTAWGALVPGAQPVWAMVARWVLEYLVPSGFALGMVLSPERVFSPLFATLARPGVASGAGPPVRSPSGYVAPGSSATEPRGVPARARDGGPVVELP
jgi:hypothetical protein